MPKDLTPHQVSRGLTYVQKEAPFLAKLKQGSAEAARKNAKFENYVDGQDDDDYDELEGAQVVELDEHGREIHKDAGAADEDGDDESKDDDEDEEQPATDENGRILFRAKSKNKKKRKASEQDQDKDAASSTDAASNKKKKAKKAKKPTVKLSFENDEEE